MIVKFGKIEFYLIFDIFYKNNTTLPIIIINIAIVFGIKICFVKFSFTICGKNFVPRTAKSKTIAGRKLLTKKTIATGAKSKAKLVKRLPVTDINSLTTLTVKIVCPPVRFICRNASRKCGINKNMSKPDNPKPRYSQKDEIQKLFPPVTYLNMTPEMAMEIQAKII